MTNACEFDCVFCPKSEMKRPYGFMDTGLAKRIITDIAKNNIAEKITFHVMGEPTLHPDFFDILSHADREGIKVGLTTNGAGLGGKRGKGLLDYNLHQIDISLQTPDEESFGLRRAGGMKFDDYIDNILSFFTSYNKRWSDTIFKFRFLNTRFRKREMEKSRGEIDVISSTEELRNIFVKWADRIYDILGVGEGERAAAINQLRGIVSYKWNVIEIYPNVFFETYMLEDWGHAFDEKKIMDAWGGYCFGMRDHFSILYNGDVTLCTVDFE
ncbi:MAG: radical SAM protein [Nitrospirae bacterium]|nr:radical SAM protein [Nitrospirota bacterium]